MSEWSAGYVSDIGYTFGYYSELNPLHASLPFLNARIALPAIGTACELGFGQGISVSMHAAASTAQWFGTDFNPSQAAGAQELVRASGADAQLLDETFSDFAQRPDLPDFDYIGLHGIWSWISEANRRVIVDFIRRKLKVGGVLYISYNTLPGWSAFSPIRHLLVQHAQVLGSEGRGIVHRIDGALEFADKLWQTEPGFAKANPQVSDRLKAIETQNRHYLAHEYFNQDWEPMYFSDMAQWLSEAKLQYACSAHHLDHVDVLHLTDAHSQLLKDIPDLVFRETVRDFMVNQQFRRDYWVKGVRRISSLEQTQALRQLRFVLTSARSDVPMQLSGGLGSMDLHPQVYQPLLDCLAEHKVISLGQLEQQLSKQGLRFGQLVQAIMLLVGAGHIRPAQAERVIPVAQKRCDQLNAHLLNKARSSDDVSYLASPVLGGGIGVSRFAQLFLLAMQQGLQGADAWAQFVWRVVSVQGQRLVKNGVTLEQEADCIAELKRQAQEFSDKQLPVLKSLQVV